MENYSEDDIDCKLSLPFTIVSSNEAVDDILKKEDIGKGERYLLCCDSFTNKYDLRQGNEYINNLSRYQFLSTPTLKLVLYAIYEIKENQSSFVENIHILIQPEMSTDGQFVFSDRDKKLNVLEIRGFHHACCKIAFEANINLIFVTGAIKSSNLLFSLDNDYLNLISAEIKTLNEHFDNSSECKSAFIVSPWIKSLMETNFEKETDTIGGFHCDRNVNRQGHGQKDINNLSSIIDNCIAKTNNIFFGKKPENATNAYFRLKRVEETETTALFALVKELALYEKEEGSVHVDASIYLRDGFKKNPLFYAFLLESVSRSTGSISVCGYALWYIGYSTWDGPFLYLEDLYIQEKFRGSGGGKEIMYTLADIAKSSDCGRFVWQALEWNHPARNFYKSIGAIELLDWISLRMDKSRIALFLSGRKY